MNDFWSRRKVAVRKEAAADQNAKAVAVRLAEEERLSERTDAEILAELDLPEPELLDDASQVREFLNAAIPQRLKARALRRLWRLNPVLANLDGLVDYGEDFTDSTRVIENLQTAYVVGKGMLTRFEEILNTETPDVEAEDEGLEESAFIVSAPPSEFMAPAHAMPTQDTVEDDPDTQAYAPPSTRRMRFRFEPAQET
ncbi:DUF3306 domain-containing protein [Thalassovita sp.]|uniref:DUF3306 domain-containing protein n=1 Tax=Thalassovita sp. TaxID=1979401 RepID=UPI0029DE6326|nr:DUF3306 domain-containing protein [Thalassovita sp.]